jgi:choline dehydrogenase-like flavoprotein
LGSFEGLGYYPRMKAGLIYRARLTEAQEPKLYLRGRGVGGSSAINAQGAVRGLSTDFNVWAAQGCTGWAWEDVLPFFIRLEDDVDYGDRPYHGRGGPIPIGRTPPERWGAVCRAFLEAAMGLGHPWCEDVNAPAEGDGIFPLPPPPRAPTHLTTVMIAEHMAARIQGRHARGIDGWVDRKKPNNGAPCDG